MKTSKQIQERAELLAHSHFHCDDGQQWEPFENWSEEDIAEGIEALADVIARAMHWAQEKF